MLCGNRVLAPAPVSQMGNSGMDTISKELHVEGDGKLEGRLACVLVPSIPSLALQVSAEAYNYVHFFQEQLNRVACGDECAVNTVIVLLDRWTPHTTGPFRCQPAADTMTSDCAGRVVKLLASELRRAMAALTHNSTTTASRSLMALLLAVNSGRAWLTHTTHIHNISALLRELGRGWRHLLAVMDSCYTEDISATDEEVTAVEAMLEATDRVLQRLSAEMGLFPAFSITATL